MLNDLQGSVKMSMEEKDEDAALMKVATSNARLVVDSSSMAAFLYRVILLPLASYFLPGSLWYIPSDDQGHTPTATAHTD